MSSESTRVDIITKGVEASEVRATTLVSVINNGSGTVIVRQSSGDSPIETSIQQENPIGVPMQNAIVFFGNTGVGKSYVCNRIFDHHGSPTRFQSSGSTQSETQQIQYGMINRNGTNFTLVDTPGFFDNRDPENTAKVDGENMCKVVSALEACDQVYGLIFIFTDRFSLPHKMWYERLRDLVTPAKAGHIVLVHNKQNAYDARVHAKNSILMSQQLGGPNEVDYIWLSNNGDEGQIEGLLDVVTKFVPFKLENLIVPQICYQDDEIGPEFEEVIAETTKDEGRMEKELKDTSHTETEVMRGNRRFLGVLGPKDTEFVHKWVPGSVHQDVWVTKMVTRRSVGIYQNLYKVRFDGTKDLAEKKLVRKREEVF